VVLGNAEQEIPAFKLCADTASGYAFFVYFLDVGKGRIRGLQKSLAAQFPVHEIVDFPEPASQGGAAGEGRGQRLFFVIL
jgi:hypothetical protein